MSYFFYFFKKHFDTYEQQLEEEQDLMGLYESELSKQILLRNRQRKEWEMMKKKCEIRQQQKQKESSELEQQQLQEKEAENRTEIAETDASKKLTNAMLASARDKKDDTLQKAVEVLHNQNGNLTLLFIL